MREQRFQGRQITVESKIDQAARLAAAIFALKGWEYGWKATAHVPDRDELAKFIQTLLKTVAENDDTISDGCGRFMVEWNEDFERYEVMLILTDLSPRELYEETGIDRKVRLTEES